MAMTRNQPEHASGQADAAIAEFLDAARNGQAPDRDEFLKRHRHIASELKEFLEDHAAVDGAARLFAAGASSSDREGFSGRSESARQALTCPRPFGKFELLAEIARGGMGIVYRARQTTPERVVALKMILAGQLASQACIDRFYAEAHAAAALDHPSIVPIFEVGECDAQHYFTMALVDGGSLAERLGTGSLPPREAAEIMRTVAIAVHYAHECGVIHRDLKPGNILLDSHGRVRVSDFSLARRQSDASSLTATGQLLGTPSFMPPEQVSGQQELVGPASDVYSLGATLYALITGRPPFLAPSSIETLKQVLEQDPVSPRQLDPTVPRDLETIALKCLEKSPLRRYASARLLAEDIGRFLDDQPIAARRPTGIYRMKKFVRRNKVVAAASVAVMAALLAGTAISSIEYLHARRQADLARTKAAQRQQAILFLKDTLRAVGLPAEGELADLDRLFDDAALLAAEDKVESAKQLRLRGTLRARIGRWDEATADCLLANRLALDGGDWSFDSAIVLLRAGRYEDYGRICHALLARASDARTFVAADMGAKASLLFPVSGVDFERACELADFSATETGPAWHLPCVRLCKALAEYRRSRFDSALEWAKLTRGSHSITPRHRAAAHFIEACTHFAQRQPASGRDAFKKGESALNEPFDAFAKVFGDTWCDVTIAERLRNEARIASLK
jgi:hypothetical protein